ncbi:MAG TPA: haloacid dehalogenase type II [Gemmatimonadaceae bacterium]|nr:haloacid dehalogenase type II [Gemmatimonadaceae bacterium]
MKPVIVFDLNETLLDMSGLDPAFARIFERPDGSELRKKWFKQVLELFLTATITGKYRSFDNLTDDALQMLAAQQGRRAGAEDRARLEKSVAELTAYPDVRPGLERLKHAGFTVATLTNSGNKSATMHLEHAGLRELFDEILSVEAVERYKPAREAYEYAAKALKVDVGDIILVAAHDWDIAGALAAGCKAAFVRRPEKVLSPGADEPQFDGRDVRELSEQFATKHA